MLASLCASALVGLAMATPLDAGTSLVPELPAGDPRCVDAQGLWNIPNGLIIGGPDDNTHEPAYAGWVELCGFVVEETVEDVFTPFEEVLDSWLLCQRENAMADYELALAGQLPAEGARAHGHDDRHPSLADAPATPATLATPDASGALDGLEAEQASGDAEDPCGAAPAARQVLPDGTLLSKVPAIHVGSAHGSIKFSAYSYASTSNGGTDQKGRMGTVFWGNGGGANMKAKLTSMSHWQDAHAHHAGSCGNTFHAYIWDAQHWTTDKWWSSTPQVEAHHESSWDCWARRYHIRSYGDGLFDSHTPGFGYYNVANVHWDDYAHDNPDGPKGVTHLHGEYTQFGATWHQTWSNEQGNYIYFYRLYYP